MLARSIAALGVLVATGCASNTQPTYTNPFTTADRVPPPATRLAPGAAQPYYPGSPAPAATFATPAPAFASPGAATAPPPFVGGTSPAPAYGSPTTTPLPPQNFGGAAPSPFTPQSFSPPGAPAQTAAPQPFGAAAPASQPFGGSATRPMSPLSSATPTPTRPGDNVAIPGDSTPLRFGEGAHPAPLNPRAPQSLAARTAVTGGWISGSAPVRSTVSGGDTALAAAPRVRMPGGQAMTRQPVNVAALDPPAESSAPETIGWR